MKRKYIALACLFSLSTGTFAQDCNQESVAQQPGKWMEGLRGSQSGVPTSELASEKKVVATLHNMIKSKYRPIGVEANFTGAYDMPSNEKPGNGYWYGIHFLNFYCEGTILKTVHETSTYFSISANMFDAEIYEEASDQNPEGYYSMSDMPIEKDGHYYFKEKDASLGFGLNGKSSMWLVTYDGKLPFSYVSKKDFLLKRKQLLSDQILSSALSSKDVLTNLEIEKKYKETEYKGDQDKLQKYLKMDYQPRKDRYEKLLAENEKSYAPAFAKIEALLKMPAADLSQPAIVKVDPQDHLSYLFTDDNDTFGKVLIKPNALYFKKLPKSSPQFFWVQIRGNHKDPIAAKAMTDVMSAVDFAALKGMLGK
jgi:hypothetical protein